MKNKKKMEVLPKKPKLNKRDQIRINTIKFLNELSCAQLKHVCRIINCASSGTKNKMIKNIFNITCQENHHSTKWNVHMSVIEVV